MDRHGSPTQHKQREFTHLKNQLSDLRCKTKKAPPTLTRPINVRKSDSRGSDEAVEGAPQRHAQNQEASEETDRDMEQDLAEHVLKWTKLEKRMQTLLGEQNTQQLTGEQFAIPPTKVLDTLISRCQEEANKIANENVKRMKAKRDATARWDWEQKLWEARL